MLMEAVAGGMAVAEPHDVLALAVEDALAELRPTVQRDGGDIELVTIEGDMVVVDMKGSCAGCVLASVTLAGVRKKIIEAAGRPVRVVPLSATTIRRP
jgi:Thioredoxin-like proteins and domains